MLFGGEVMNFLNEVELISEELIQLRRELHQNPELDFKLFKTNDIIKQFLQREGISYKPCGGTGIVAQINGTSNKGKGKTIALRTDMDALPIKEKTKLEYASKIEGAMHACGHDAHMTMVLGAAKLLNKHKHLLEGNVKIIFEPAEETTGGAKVMIEEGALENPSVDAIIGCHVDESIPAGTVGVKRGVAYAASNPFSITIYGKGTHGASPHKGIDPITIAVQVISSLQLLISRETNPVNPAVITIGTINGGTAANVIPEKVVITGIIRTMTLKDREYIIKRLEETVELQVKSLKGSCSIVIDESYPCLYNNEEMFNSFMKYTSELIGSSKVKEIETPTLGVESFAYFSLKIPALFYHVGCGNNEKGINHPLHSCYFNIDEDCLKIGTAVHCNMIEQLLKNLN